MRSRLWVLVAWMFASAACGPGDLPAFANPPPEPDAGLRDASADEDAGSADGGMRDASDDSAK
jgi:hypothetical protein